MSANKGLTCPKCRDVMVPVVFATVEVDRCTGCGGLWFDALEKEALVRLKAADEVDIGSEAVGRKQNAIDRIKCPHCESQMLRLVDAEQSHVWFEQCHGCGGSFLDAGELKALQGGRLSDFFNRIFANPRM